MYTKSPHLQHWLLDTNFGANLLANELNFCHNIIKQIFGQCALQLGMPKINFLAASKIRNCYQSEVNIHLAFNQLPFAANSYDLIICPHTLETVCPATLDTDAANYIIMLQQLQYILAPSGYLIIINFNPYSLINLFKPKSPIFKKYNFIPLSALQLALNRLNLRISGGQFMSYQFPTNNAKFLAKTHNILDKIGDRWFASCANLYALIVTKDVCPMTMIDSREQLQQNTPVILTTNYKQ